MKVLRPTAVRPAASALAVVPYLIPYLSVSHRRQSRRRGVRRHVRPSQLPSSVVSRASGREKRKVSLGYSQHLLQCGNQQLQLQQPRPTSPNKPSNRPNSANLLKPVADCHAAAVPCAKTAASSPSFSQQQHSLSRSPFCFSRVSFCAGVRGFLSQPSCPHGPIKSSNVAPVSPFRSCHLPPPLHLRQPQKTPKLKHQTIGCRFLLGSNPHKLYSLVVTTLLYRPVHLIPKKIRCCTCTVMNGVPLAEAFVKQWIPPREWISTIRIPCYKPAIYGWTKSTTFVSFIGINFQTNQTLKTARKRFTPRDPIVVPANHRIPTVEVVQRPFLFICMVPALHPVFQGSCAKNTTRILTHNGTKAKF